jgi:hypothetical protein
MATNTGTKSHKIHSKQAVANQFQYGRKSWKLYWKIQNLLIELGFSYERTK